MGKERDKILAEFDVDEHGIIRTLGKFEGEMIYAPYIYGTIMDGGGGDESYYLPQEDRMYDVVIPTASEKADFPELADVIGLICWTSDQGFFYIETYTEGDEAKFNAAIAELEELASEDIEE